MQFEQNEIIRFFILLNDLMSEKEERRSGAKTPQSRALIISSILYTPQQKNNTRCKNSIHL